MTTLEALSVLVRLLVAAFFWPVLAVWALVVLDRIADALEVLARLPPG